MSVTVCRNRGRYLTSLCVLGVGLRGCLLCWGLRDLLSTTRSCCQYAPRTLSIPFSYTVCFLSALPLSAPIPSHPRHSPLPPPPSCSQSGTHPTSIPVHFFVPLCSSTPHPHLSLQALPHSTLFLPSTPPYSSYTPSSSTLFQSSSTPSPSTLLHCSPEVSFTVLHSILFPLLSSPLPSISSGLQSIGLLPIVLPSSCFPLLLFLSVTTSINTSAFHCCFPVCSPPVSIRLCVSESHVLFQSMTSVHLNQ